MDEMRPKCGVEVRAYFYLPRGKIEIYGVVWSNGIAHSAHEFFSSSEGSLEELKPGKVNEPILRITEKEAQQLFEDLWNIGLRPKDIGTAGHLAATQYHLKDVQDQLEKMRKQNGQLLDFILSNEKEK